MCAKLFKMVAICTIGIGIVIVAADDLVGVGVADDFLYGPFGGGIGKGLTMIFG